MENPQVVEASKRGVSNPIKVETIEKCLTCKAKKKFQRIQRKDNPKAMSCSPFICVTQGSEVPILAFLTVSQVKDVEYYSLFEGKFNVSTVWSDESLPQMRDLLREPMLYAFLNGCEVPIYVNFYLGSLQRFGSISWFGALFNAIFGKCPLVIFEATAVSVADQIFWAPIQQLAEKSSLVEFGNDPNLIAYRQFWLHPVTVFAVNMVTMQDLRDHESDDTLFEWVGTKKLVTIDQVINTGIVHSLIFGPITAHTIKSFTNSDIGALS